MLLQNLLIHTRLIVETFKVCFADELDQILIAGQVSSQKNQMIVVVVGKTAVFLRVPAAQRHIGFAADDGFDACIFGFAVELDGAEHIAMVGHGDGRLSKGLDLLDERLDLICAVEETELGVKMEMDEGRSHGAILGGQGR